MDLFFASIFKYIYVGRLAETLGAEEIRECRRLISGNMRGFIVPDQTIEDVTALASKLR